MLPSPVDWIPRGDRIARVAVTARALQQLFPALLFCAVKSVERSTRGASGLPWKELPRCTEFIVECLVAVSFQQKNFHKCYKTR